MGRGACKAWCTGARQGRDYSIDSGLLFGRLFEMIVTWRSGVHVWKSQHVTGTRAF